MGNVGFDELDRLALEVLEPGAITLGKVDALKVDAELTLEGINTGCVLDENKAPACGDNAGLKVLTEPAEAEATEPLGTNSIDCALAVFIKQRARKSSFFIPSL